MAKLSLQSINLFIRSLIFAVFSLSAIVCYGTLLLAAVVLSVRQRHAVIRLFLKSYVRALEVICQIHYEVEGLEHIPPNRVGVVMSKHQSTWETFFLPTIFHAPAVILKRELCWLPFFGWGLALSDPIAINRNDRSSAMQQVLIKGKKRLDDGRWVLIFPEGTRVAAGTVGNYRLGGARLAVATGYPIIPVAHNAGRCWPRRKFIKYPGTIKVVIGPPIASVGQTPESLLAQTKDWIETTMMRIDGFVDKSAG